MTAETTACLSTATAAMSAEQAALAAADAQKALRRCLGQFPTGVTVVTANVDGQKIGMTANSFSSVSLDPPLILWSIRRASARASLFTGTQSFAINVLSAQQTDIARNFASSAGDPFAASAWHEGNNGAPLIAAAVAHLECSLEAVFDGGDHHIIIGRVTQHACAEGAPLLFVQGQFALSQPYTSVIEALNTAKPSADALPHALMRLLRKAYSSVSDGFDQHRRALGLSPLNARLLAALEEGPASVDQLASSIFTDAETVKDVLHELFVQNLIEADAQQFYSLSRKGLQTRSDVAARVAEYSKEHFADFCEQELATLERLLNKIKR